MGSALTLVEWLHNEGMALTLVDQKGLQGTEIRKSKSFLFSETSLASLESLTMPLVCTLSLSFSLSHSAVLISLVYGLMRGVCSEQVQEVVLSADIRCAECQKRVADIMARMNGKILVRPSIDYAWILNT